MTGVKVYLRKADEPDGKPLGEAPLHMLADESVLDIIGGWGLYVDGVGLVDRKRLVGQFSFDSRGAVFEVIVTDDDD